MVLSNNKNQEVNKLSTTFKYFKNIDAPLIKTSNATQSMLDNLPSGAVIEVTGNFKECKSEIMDWAAKHEVNFTTHENRYFMNNRR